MADTCIIVPCYNEAKRIAITAFQNFIEQSSAIDFCFVNDGSQDKTKDLLESLSNTSARFQVLHLDKNVGKAEAIRQGVLHLDSTYAFIGYLDADLSTPLNEIERLNIIANTSKKTFIMGSRIKLVGTKIERRLKRHISGRIIATFIDDFILKLGIYDTQCGAKIIESKLAKELFQERFQTKWLFDVELIIRAKIKHGKTYCLHNIVEIPLLVWKDIGDSKITFTDILKLPLDFLKINRHYR